MRLLIATGGSPHSEVALRLGTQIARHASVTPTVLTVIKGEMNRARATLILARACELLKPELSDLQTKVRLGQAAEEIIQEAKEGDYDLIIVGERRDHDLVTRFLGSTAKRVIEHAPCPVIVAKGKSGPIHRILLCDSGAESQSLLNRFTERLPALVEGEVEVTVLHVMSQITAGPGVPGKQLRANAEELIQAHTPEGELLERDIQILEQSNLHPQAKVRHGLVVDEILAEARSGDHDLVVIGAHRGAGWERLLLDDLARQIIEQMDRPVLVLR
ncbi:MAG: universal stress protein [Chloroflexi bacterium]|nr:universal stress protein [Chloroflexota bacterium]